MDAAPLDRNLRVAVVDDTAIFLDIARNRYFALPADIADAFDQAINGRPLSAGERRVIDDLLKIGDLDEIVAEASASRRHLRPKPRLDFNHHIEVSPSETAVAVAGIVAARTRLAAFGLSGGLRHLLSRKMNPGAPVAMALPRIAGAHRRAARWYSAHGQCLARSLALSAALWRFGIGNELIIGVKMLPFGAHSWVQIGDGVVNDRPERVLPFAPILIV